MRQLWEYDILLNDAETAESFEELQNQAAIMKARLNDRGAKGWELLALGNGIYVFKRLLLPRERGRLGCV